MKRNILIALLLTLTTLAACQTDDVEQATATDEKSEETKEEKNPHEHKATASISEIEEDELYRWEIDAERDIVLVNKSGEIETLDQMSMLGKEGDRTFEGTAELYLVYEGEEHGYLEDEVDLELVNLDREFASSYSFADNTIIDLYKPESSVIDAHHLWYFDGQDATRVMFEDEEELYVSSSTLKFIDDEYMQSYTYDNAGMGDTDIGWHFHTRKWDEETHSFTSFDHQSFTADETFGWETGEMEVEQWNEYKDYYIHFPRITMTEEHIELMAQGSLIDDSIKIGDPIDELVKQMSQQSDYVSEDYYNGAPYYTFFTPYTYLYDESSRNINTILMAGTVLTNDLSSLRNLLGEPKEEPVYSEMEDSYIEEYIVGDYSIMLSSLDDELLALELYPNRANNN